MNINDLFKLICCPLCQQKLILRNYYGYCLCKKYRVSSDSDWCIIAHNEFIIYATKSYNTLQIHNLKNVDCSINEPLMPAGYMINPLLIPLSILHQSSNAKIFLNKVAKLSVLL